MSRGLSQRLLRNTAYSGVAYAAIAVVGLVLVPVIIGAYGLAAYGLITISRALLPSGIFGLLDLGVSETATVAVARARGDRNWARASEQIAFLLVISATIATVVAALLIVYAPELARLFRADAPLQASFVLMLEVTGASLCLLFPALVVEGVVKGFERFGWLRFWEIVGSLLFAASVAASTWSGLGYEYIQFGFLAALGIRYFALGIIAVSAAREVGLRLRPWGRNAAAEVYERAVLGMQSKVMGALHLQAPALLVALCVGPSGVAIYDVITKIPRYIKPVLGLVASTLVPAAAQLHGAGESDRVRRITATSLWLLPALAFPPLLGAIVLAKPILAIWVGEAFSAHWPWLSLMLLVPLLHSIQMIGHAAMFTQLDFVRRTNRIAVLMLIVQYLVSFTMVPILEERAFVLGQVTAMILTFPLALRQLTAASGTATSSVVRTFLKMLVPGGVLAGFAFPATYLVAANGAAAYMFLLAGWCFLYWMASYWLVLNAEQRSLVTRLMASATGRTAS